jgi:hypothetical protein
MKNISTWIVLILTLAATVGGSVVVFNETGSLLTALGGGVLIGFVVLFIGGLSVSWH